MQMSTCVRACMHAFVYEYGGGGCVRARVYETGTSSLTETTIMFHDLVRVSPLVP